MDKLKAKREELVEKVAKYETLTAPAESRDLTVEEKAQEKSMSAEIKSLKEEIEMLERIENSKKQKAKEKFDTAVGAEQDNASEEKELRSVVSKYRFSKAFQAIHNKKNIDGVEAEMYQEAQKEMEDSGQSLQGNIAVPSKMIKVGPVGRRKLLDVATEGTDTVFTEYGGLIPFLNPVPKVTTLGITVLQGLRGNVKWVRHNGEIAFAWETENADVDETTPTFDSIDISPKRVGGYLDVSTQMLKQNVFVLEPFLRSMLERRYALTVDTAVINGSGSSNQPTGILNYSGVNTLSLGSSGGDMTYGALLQMIRDVKTAKSRQGSAGWLTNAYGEFALANTPKQASGVEGNFILNPDSGTLIGRRFVTSENVPSNLSEGSQSDLCAMIYSDYWQSAILGTWGGLDILFDPYTQALGGKVRFVCQAFMDIEIEHATEFSICKDWDATDLPAAT